MIIFFFHSLLKLFFTFIANLFRKTIKKMNITRFRKKKFGGGKDQRKTCFQKKMVCAFFILRRISKAVPKRIEKKIPVAVHSVYDQFLTLLNHFNVCLQANGKEKQKLKRTSLFDLFIFRHVKIWFLLCFNGSLFKEEKNFDLFGFT